MVSESDLEEDFPAFPVTSNMKCNSQINNVHISRVSNVNVGAARSKKDSAIGDSTVISSKSKP